MRIDLVKLGRIYERVLFLTICLVYCIILLNSVVLPALADVEVDSTQFYFSVGSGDSMEPKISRCDLLLYQDKPFSQVERGDIIAYEHPARDEIIVHKYMGDHVAKGINNKYADSTEVTKENYRKTVRSILDTSGFCG